MDTTAKEQVLSEIAALEEQVRLFTAEMENINSAEVFNPAQYSAIKAELDTANSKLEAKKAELTTIEDAGQAAQEELMTFFDAIDVGGGVKVRARDLALDELSYQMLLIGIAKKFTDQAQQNAQIIAALKSSYESQIEELEDGMAEISALREENYRLADKAADLELKRDAAALVNEEKDAEIARLKADNDNLRKQMQTSTAPAETNLTFDAAAAREAFLASLPAVYNKREYDKNNWVANLVDSDEEVVWMKIYSGKYREVTQAEADSFRAEQAAQPVEEAVEENIQDTTLGGSTLEPPAFETPTVSVPSTSDTGELLLSPEEVTRRLIALEKRVDQIIGA